MNLKTGVYADGAHDFLVRGKEKVASHLSQLHDLKLENPNLKTLAAFGGANDSMNVFWSSMVANSDSRSAFAQNCFDLINTHKLDGIDIDWEYPNFKSDNIPDKTNFVLLLKELRKKFGASFLLSAAIGPGVFSTNRSYLIPEIFNECDFVNLMT